MKISSLAGMLTIGLLAVSTTARADYPVNINFTLTALVQKSGFTYTYKTNKTTGDVLRTQVKAAPTQVKFGTKDILNRIATVENVAGNWPSNSFPSGASLAMISGDFFVVKGTNVLLDVSAIISEDFGSTDVYSSTYKTLELNVGGEVEQGGTETDFSHVTLTYDDTSLANDGGIKFTLTGFDKVTYTDSATASDGTYAETAVGSLTNISGEGTYKGDELVLTGSATHSGKGKQGP